MLRRLILSFSLAAAWGALQGAIWPPQLGSFTRGELKQVPVTNSDVWDEYGLLETEQTEYSAEGRHFGATAYRFRDPTGALAAFQWQRPAGSKPSKVGELAVETAGSLLLAFHNYLLRIEGWKPAAEELAPLLQSLPRVDQSSLPTLPGYLPSVNLIPNSERYVVGPASLEMFSKEIPPSLAAFHLGAEAQFGRFRSQHGEISMGVFSYPTPAIARQQVEAFSARLPGALVKRSGPLLAVVLPPADPDEAEKLLAKVQYEATITWNERVPTKRDNIGNLILNILLLCGLLILVCLAGGLFVGGMRLLRKRLFKNWEPEDAMIRLRLDGR